MAEKQYGNNLSDIVNVKTGFQSSVNIAYDIDRDDKIKEFIPTSSTLEVIEKMLLATANNETRRAKILIGAYGKGKSHLVLMFLAVLQKKDKKSLSRLLEYIKKENKELYKFIINNIISDNNAPFIPVVIDGNNSDLEQAFILALQNTITKYELSNIELNTNYKAVLNKINDWKNNYNSTYEEFNSKINGQIDTFIKNIKRCDSKAYNKFVDIYPTLTSGSQFQPMVGFNIVNLYAEFADKIVEKGYRGIYIVFDEFSKYLESSITTATLSETKLLQDLAEKCSRSGNKQMHFLLITHKDIANYIDKLPKDKIDGWKGVSERFEHIEIRNDFAQMYEIIGNVLCKDKKIFDSYINDNSISFRDVINLSKKYKLFTDVDNMEDVIKNTYPLHPVTAFILPRLSELIAQNERTLFTFLSLDSKNTAYNYIKNASIKFSLLTPDVLFDYFEPLFRQESYLSKINSEYNLVSKIILRLDNKLSIDIVKTIALIYMVNQFDRLVPTKDMIIYVYKHICDAKDIMNAIEQLENKYYFLHENQSNKYIKLKETTGIDVRKKCLDEVERIKLGNNNTVELLNKSYSNIYFYPNQYNDENQIVRYMPFTFISSGELNEEDDWDERSGCEYIDGMVYGVLLDSQCDYDVLINKIKRISSGAGRCVFVISKNSCSIYDKIYMFQAIVNLRKQALGDTALSYEYDILLNDVLEEIKLFVASFTNPEEQKSIYFYNGTEVDIKRKRQLSHLLTKICNTYYSGCPIINNEIINKNTISKVAFGARTKLINALFEEDMKPSIGEKGSSQCLSFAKSVLVRTGLLEDFEESPKFNLYPNNNMSDVIRVIEKFIEQSNKNNPSSFALIYDKLRHYKYNIGLKKGVIPVLLAVVIAANKKNIIITYNTSENESNELPINAELMNSIDNCPEKYCIIFDTWDDKKDEYVNAIKNVFDIEENVKGYSSLNILTKYIQQWYFNLPSITRETENYEDMFSSVKNQLDIERLTSASKKIKKRLHNPINNHRKFIFKKIKNSVDSEDVRHFVYLLKTFKYKHDHYKNVISKKIIDKSIKMFISDRTTSVKKMCLSSAFAIWFNNMNEATKENVFSGSVRNFIELVKEDIQDDNLCITKLASILTGIRIEDWNDKTINEFFDELINVKNTIEKYNNTLNDKSTFDDISSNNIIQENEYLIASNDDVHGNIVKRFKRVEYKNSKRANLLRNEIESSIEEMGESISNEEMRQVLLEIIYSMS